MTQNTQQQNDFLNEVETTNHSIILRAAAGAGKTTTLIQAAHRLQGQHILALAFNKHSANELAARMPEWVDCRTLNSVGHRAWGGFVSRRLKLEFDKIPKLVSEWMSANGMEGRTEWCTLRDLVNAARTHGLMPPDSKNKAPYAKTLHDNTEAGWEKIQAIADPEITASWTISAAEQILNSSILQAFQGIIDFNDQLYMPTVFGASVSKFPIVFVDEAQDLNALQHKLVASSVAPGGRLIAVGDPRQAIYGWRGALTDSLDQLKDKFKAKEMPLSVCFRCAKAVVAEARKVFPEIDPFEGAPQGKISNVPFLDVTQLRPGDLVVCRNNAPLIRKAYAAIRKGIGVKYLGRDIERSIIAVLKKVVKGGEDGFPNYTWSEIDEPLKAWQERQLKNAEEKNQYMQMEVIRDKYECLQNVRKATGDSASISSAVQFLREMFDMDGTITLATVHKAKGLEFDRVWFLNQSLIPGRYVQKALDEAQADFMEAYSQGMSIEIVAPLQVRVDHANDLLEQEYNIDYVARTRAKHELIYADED